MSLPKPKTTTVHWRVAVYWVREQAYGGWTKCKSLADGVAHAEKLNTLGYGKEGENPIHVVRQTTNTWEFFFRKEDDGRNEHGSSSGIAEKRTDDEVV